MKVLVVISVLVGVALAAQSRYDNYKVLSLHVAHADQFEAVMQLESMGYLYMDTPHGVGHNADIIVPPHKFAEIEEIIEKYNFKSKVMMENLQEAIDKEGRVRGTPRAVDFGWEAYYPLETIYEWMEELKERFPDFVTLLDIGETHEGRRIKGLKVSFREGNPGIFVESNIHAREWISSAVSTWIINLLLTSDDTTVRNLAYYIDWYFIPVLNPDGFVHTHTSSRLWRKSRRPANSLCVGTDLNRNFDFHWMTGGASSNGCLDTYGGPEAFSDKETQAIRDFYITIAGNITAYIDFHSYSQLLMYPYGTTTAGDISNRGEHDAIGLRMQAALASRYGTRYDFGNIVTTIYVASGGSIDWVKGVHDTPLVYVYELRDTGAHGFVLPADQIIPNAEEVWDSLVTMVVEARSRGYFPQG